MLCILVYLKIVSQNVYKCETHCICIAQGAVVHVMANVKAPITTAAADKFCDIFSNFQK